MATAEVQSEHAEAEVDEERRKALWLSVRINDIAPDVEADVDEVESWTEEERAAVIRVLDDPPQNITAVAEGLPEWFDDTRFGRVAFGALRAKLDRALKREDRVRKAERRLADEKSALYDIDDQIEDLKKQRKGAESRVEAAVFALQRAVTDQEAGQNALPFGEAAEEVITDPAATAPIADLGLSESFTEKLTAAEIATVGDLVGRINADELWHRKIKGVGEKRVDELIDALNAWRQEHPAPSALV